MRAGRVILLSLPILALAALLWTALRNNSALRERITAHHQSMPPVQPSRRHGDKAPDLEGRALGGQEVRLTELLKQSRCTAVAFASTTTAESADQVRDLWLMHQRLSEKALRIVIVVLGERMVAQEWAKLIPGIPVVFDNAEHHARQYGVRTYPTTFLLDPRGRIEYVQAGYRKVSGSTRVHQKAELMLTGRCTSTWWFDNVPRRGATAPDMWLDGGDHQLHRIRTWAGQPVTIAFLNIDCDAAPAVLEFLDREARVPRSHLIRFVAVFEGFSPELVRDYARAHGPFTNVLLLGDSGGNASEAFGVTECPRIFCLDSAGKVAYTHPAQYPLERLYEDVRRTHAQLGAPTGNQEAQRDRKEGGRSTS